MIRRRLLLTIGSAIFGGCIMDSTQASTEKLYDDGRIQIRLMGRAKYVHGDDFVTVSVVLATLGAQREVLVGTGGALRVNGATMRRDRLPVFPRGWEEVYLARVPIGDGTLQFEYIRSADVRLTFTATMPVFEVAAYPREYSAARPMILELSRNVSNAHANEDIFVLGFGGDKFNNLGYTGPPVTEYQVTFKPNVLGYRASFGPTSAVLIRQQNVPMNRLVPEMSEGWIKLVVEDKPFYVNVGP